ncbi:MAG TPA: glycosyltransferase family 2 protein [Candidatus Saccharimonadales bacterium]|nr:glycosyltransferase family 2 protein [Candidatus Saccharimonadales bacterium]
MSSNHPTVSIVVLNWNGKKFIDPFVESFKKLNYPSDKLELIFTDNDSSDGSVEYIKKKYKSLKQLKVIQTGGNYGYAGGNNRGMKHATGDYVLVCNNDLILDPKLVDELVKEAKSKSSAITVPKLMFLNKPGYINNAGSMLEANNIWPVKERGFDQKDSKEFEKTVEITAFCGACVLFERRFLEDVGLFDGKFFMYFEDGDLSWRGQKSGYKYYIAPKALAFHEHTGTSKEGSPLFNYYVGRNRLLILMKNAKFRVVFKAWLVVLHNQLYVKVRKFLRSVIRKNNRKENGKDLLLGIKVVASALLFAPYCYLKRWKLLPEEKL